MKQIEKDCQDEMDATNFSNDQINEQKQKLHICIDKHLATIATKLKAYSAKGNTEKYIQIYSSAIEQATAEFGQLDSEAYQRIAGRSKINVKMVKESKPAVFVQESENLQHPCHAEATRSLG